MKSSSDKGGTPWPWSLMWPGEHRGVGEEVRGAAMSSRVDMCVIIYIYIILIDMNV